MAAKRLPVGKDLFRGQVGENHQPDAYRELAKLCIESFALVDESEELSFFFILISLIFL